MTGKRFLRPRDAAAYLGLRPQTLARWRCEGGKIPFVRLGRAVAYDVADLDAFAAAQKQLRTVDREDRGPHLDDAVPERRDAALWTQSGA